MTTVIRRDRVTVAPLAEAFQRSGLTLGYVCRHLGWTRPYPDYPNGGKPDTTRLARALGLAPMWNPRTRRFDILAQGVNYDLAVRIADAIGVDPVDVGL